MISIKSNFCHWHTTQKYKINSKMLIAFTIFSQMQLKTQGISSSCIILKFTFNSSYSGEAWQRASLSFSGCFFFEIEESRSRRYGLNSLTARFLDWLHPQTYVLVTTVHSEGAALHQAFYVTLVLKYRNFQVKRSLPFYRLERAYESLTC